MSARLARGLIWLRAAWSRLRRRRIPLLLQSNMVECGAACLAMLLSYYGRATNVAECYLRCGVGRDGITARTLAEAARSYGMRVKALSLDLPELKFLQLPAIVHWNFDHFMILEHLSGGRMQVVDPAVGRRILTRDEFDRGFTGIALTLEPGEHFERARPSKPPLWRRYAAFVLGRPGVLAQVLGASLLLQLLGLVLPAFTKIIADQHHDIKMLQGGNLLALLGAGLLVLMVAQALLSYLRSALLIYLQARLDAHLMSGFFEHLLGLPTRFFEQRPSGDLLQRLSSNNTIREIMTGQVIAGLLDSGMVLVYLAILLSNNLVFGAIVLGIGLVQLALFATTPRVRELMQRDLAAQSETQSYLVEALTGVQTLKAAGAEDRAFDHWSNIFFNQLNVTLRRNQLTALIEAAMSVLRTFSPIVLLWVGAGQVLNGSMSLGSMLALNVIAAMFLTPLSSVVSSGQRLQLAGVHLQRLADILDAELEQDLQAVQPAPAISGRIQLRELGFRYDLKGPWALQQISLSVEPGQKIAIVGRTGSGKSTLARLLLGLYPPSSGEIFFDGHPLRTLSYRSLRRQCGVVLQDSQIFSGSIRDNIAFNDPELPLETVVRAARLAAIHDEIEAMPMGYQTRLGEGGGALSGGQRQRLALARALARQPALLILDEATSHLDVITEAQVEQQLSALKCTRIVIAHRLSTVRNADLIVVLEQGRMAECGSHNQLLEQDGLYAALVRSQGEQKQQALAPLGQPLELGRPA